MKKKKFQKSLLIMLMIAALSSCTYEHCEHNTGRRLQAVEATCEEGGKTAGFQCSDCGEILTVQENVEPLGHTTNFGICSRCGEVIGGWEPEPTPTPKPKERSNCDFRKAKWGDTKKTVMIYESELQILEENDDGILATDSVAGYDAYVMYMFDNDKLYRGAYIITENYSNSGQYIVAYENLKEQLIKKYGEPNRSAIVPLERDALIAMAGEASALRYGYVVYISEWITDSTTIVMQLSAENYEEKLVIIYNDSNYEEDVASGL